MSSSNGVEEERRREEEEERSAARMELEQLRRRVAELEQSLGLQKPSRGLKFQVGRERRSNPT